MNMLLSELSDDMQSRLKSICWARDETPEQVIARFGIDGLQRAPRRITKNIKAMRETVFDDAGIRDGMAYVKMPNGRIFYGHLSEKNHRKQYIFMRDQLSPLIDEDTYLLALDVSVRYAKKLNWPCADVLPEKGGTVIECGAFLGHKSIRFIDEVIGKKGKLLAIELMPNNTDILYRNIEENGMKDCIDIVHAGVWSAPGVMSVKGKGRQRNSLLTIENLNVEQNINVRVDSVHNFINEWDQPMVDLVYMTINGAEIEGIKGAIPSFDRIKNFFVVAPYAPEGIPSAEVCRQLFEENNCKLLPVEAKSHIIASMPHNTTRKSNAFK